MYEYRRMTPAERQAVVAERKLRGFPWHEPPHFAEGVQRYMITGACYEHREFLSTSARLSEWTEALIGGLRDELGLQVHAWVILPNHYHLLLDADLAAFRRWVGRLHNGKSTQWNREDAAPGREVWRRFSDR